MFYLSLCYSFNYEGNAGASSSNRNEFILTVQEERFSEFRFIGSLGFGGKFWSNNGFYITCYSEDENSERKLIIKNVNQQLKSLYYNNL